MADFKIFVKDEAASKEAQELLFKLEYKWRGGTGVNYLKLQENFKYITAYSHDMVLGQGEKGDADKEITLAELRDLVVLKLNSKTSQVECEYKEISQEYKHYKKDVSNLNSIDVYRVLKLFDVKDPALQHAVKKILCAGDRGTKDKVQDIQEAIASLNRFLEMIKEDDDIPF